MEPGPLDLAANERLSADPVLGPVVRQNGIMTVSPASDVFKRLAKAIVRQQISMNAADSIFAKLETTVSLTPAAVCERPTEDLTAAGLSQTKAHALSELSEKWTENGWHRDYFLGLENDEICEVLTEVRGIGPWTADMALIFCFGRPDVFPDSDLGIRNAMKALLGEQRPRTELRSIASNWQPYRSYAALHLWHYVD